MALNTWWKDEPDQRYWMQITDRPDLDGPLKSPKLPRLTWGYDLVSHVQPGDRVLHWWTGHTQPGFVGWSDVKQHATVVPEYTWTPRHGEERTTPGWRAALGSFQPFPARVTAAQLLPLLEEILAINAALRATHAGGIYFPLVRYGKARDAHRQEVRAAEAYFVKFPVELFDVTPGIQSARLDESQRA